MIKLSYIAILIRVYCKSNGLLIMADTLVQIIKTFSKNDVTDFSAFIHRLKMKDGRKDLQLFNLLYKRGEMNGNSVLLEIYPNGNKEAYHALRKKLMKHLSDYIYQKQIKSDYTSETQISALVSMGKYLMEYNIMKPAWKYLCKAEQMAVRAEQFALANNIVGLQLDMPLLDLKVSIDDLLTRKQNYLSLAVEDENADTAYKIIKHRIKEAKTSYRGDANISQELERIFEVYELNKALSNRPSVVYKIMTILRSAAARNKDYYHLEPLLLGYYNELEGKVDLTKNNQLYMVRLQYMVAHTLFRNKKFADSFQYLKKLRENLRTLVKTEYVRLLPRVTQLYCANRFFTGNLHEAIRIADATFTEKLNIQPEDVLNLKLNQAIYHFFNKDYKEAARVLSSIGHSNTWCTKVAGVEWVLKKDLLDVYIQHELGHDDIASNRVRSLLRQKDLFESDVRFQRVAVFIKLVAKVIGDPEVSDQKIFYDEVEQAFNWQPIEEEDLHASVYYAWLKSKLLKEDAYNVLLDLISIY
ncbi:hypothetical protein [Carboxylicivirga sp. N1Y90]|uniref:hypothetical protein n=1 Tax=Carboxylicivirga fragile TaxID=3417571 RepID=UPI003D3566E4|nr:hypothetical protein [Marinilabiliaceae bacterium N1Y90]